MVQAFLFLGTVGCWPKCQTNSTWRICYWQNCWKSSLGPKKMLGTANIGCSVTSPGLGAYSVPCTPFAYWERKNFMQPNPWSGMQVSTQIHTHNLEVPNILLLNPLVMKQSDNSTAALRFLDSCFGFCLIQWFLASLTKRDRMSHTAKRWKNGWQSQLQLGQTSKQTSGNRKTAVICNSTIPPSRHQ